MEQGGRANHTDSMTQDSSVSPEPTVSVAQIEALSRAAKEKRPVEFAALLPIVPITSKRVPVKKVEVARILWAWPDGTITRPESLRQRMRNLKFKRAKHREEMP